MILASAPLWTLPFSALAALIYALPALVPRRLSDVHARRLFALSQCNRRDQVPHGHREAQAQAGEGFTG